MTTDDQASGVLDDTEITLGLLNTVENDSSVTQRVIAKELGIALGLANAYLKRCVKMGYIKIKQAPRNRYAYYITPNGFTEKSRLTAQYLSQSFRFFRAAREQCAELLGECDANHWTNVALAGDGDLAEITMLCAREFKIELVGMVDTGTRVPRSENDLPILRRDQLETVDAVIITDYRKPQETFDKLNDSLTGKPILFPKFLNVARTRPEFEE